MLYGIIAAGSDDLRHIHNMVGRLRFRDESALQNHSAAGHTFGGNGCAGFKLNAEFFGLGSCPAGAFSTFKRGFLQILANNAECELAVSLDKAAAQPLFAEAHAQHRRMV